VSGTVTCPSKTTSGAASSPCGRSGRPVWDSPQRAPMSWTGPAGGRCVNGRARTRDAPAPASARVGRRHQRAGGSGESTAYHCEGSLGRVLPRRRYPKRWVVAAPVRDSAFAAERVFGPAMIWPLPLARSRVQRHGPTLPVEQRSGHRALAAASGVDQQPGSVHRNQWQANAGGHCLRRSAIVMRRTRRPRPGRFPSPERAPRHHMPG
jgi:hypothetical protein